MNLKKILASLIVIAIIMAGVIIVVNTTKKEKTNTPEPNVTSICITVREYEVGTNTIIKETNVESTEELEKYTKLVSEVKPLSAEEMIDLVDVDNFLNQYEIIFEDIIIRLQNSEIKYCQYKNTKESITTLANIPNGLTELVKETLSK